MQGRALDLHGYRAIRLGGRLRHGEPRILVLHGFTGRAEDWLDCWPRDIPALAIDLPGHGGSAAPTERFMDEIERLIEVLPASVDQVVGYSLGGRVALGLLRGAPGRFSHAVVLSAHPGLSDALAREQRRSADQRWIELLQQQGVGGFVEAWERQPLFETQSGTPVHRLMRQRARRLGQCSTGLQASLRAQGLGAMPDMRAVIRGYAGQMDWIAGLDDRKFSALAFDVASLRPSVNCRLLPGVGHNPLLEAPERVSDRLRSLFAEAVGGP
jgi:2-succinyl-6-hydroxy-2,4-cyclohexadiene-1-carboxylate synthase